MGNISEEMKEQAFDDHYKKGLELEARGQYEEAFREFQAAVMKNPGVQEYIDAYERTEKLFKKKP